MLIRKMQSTRAINSANIPLEIQILEFKGIGAVQLNGLRSDRLGSNSASTIYRRSKQIYLDDVFT